MTATRSPGMTEQDIEVFFFVKFKTGMVISKENVKFQYLIKVYFRKEKKVTLPKLILILQ